MTNSIDIPNEIQDAGPKAELTITPNVVIENPNTRRSLGKVLYIISVVVAVLGLVILVFPEVTGLGLDLNRVVILLNSAISLIAGAFGLGVTLPNVPKPIRD